MVVFNKNLVFPNEVQLDNKSTKRSVETIRVAEDPDSFLIDRLTSRTDWLPMSGEKVRYHSSVPFQEADTVFPWALEIKDVLMLVWDAEKRGIFYSKGRNYTPERLRFWVLHTFLPLVLELERTYRIMHVGSVSVEGKPVLFSAFSFGGKSTLTDHFLKKGHMLLSDDSLGIEEREDGYYAIPSYPFHRPFRQLETLGYYTENFEREIKPVHAVYALEKGDPKADIEIVELRGIEKFKAFHYSSFIDFDFMKKERFEFFTEMAKHIPVYKITIPWDMERLDEVYDAIVHHVK